jgi:hypothetical protein
MAMKRVRVRARVARGMAMAMNRARVQVEGGMVKATRVVGYKEGNDKGGATLTLHKE